VKRCASAGAPMLSEMLLPLRPSRLFRMVVSLCDFRFAKSRQGLGATLPGQRALFRRICEALGHRSENRPG
jgi:hypothetical protein